ncbi:9764_t:CDS:2 [Dentiscutata heterogama]|uniref:9764_t:CDS:1 n=1 Tax=Dentiscutata heterogama TaxID=1316150 RepID=A0ACA9LQ02_9GLOM|nr:9764_t:CDS:2 [Dentiscutata heterogama]
MVKYTKERLLKNPMIVHISNCGLEITYSPIYKAYINQVFTHTTHGGAPRREVVAQELFPKKFLLDKAVIYKKLSKNDLQLLDKEIIQQSKWKIEGLVVRSVSCEQYTTNSSHLCNYCKEVQDDQVFKV